MRNKVWQEIERNHIDLSFRKLPLINMIPQINAKMGQAEGFRISADVNSQIFRSDLIECEFADL